MGIRGSHGEGALGGGSFCGVFYFFFSFYFLFLLFSSFSPNFVS